MKENKPNGLCKFKTTYDLIKNLQPLWNVRMFDLVILLQICYQDNPLWFAAIVVEGLGVRLIIVYAASSNNHVLDIHCNVQLKPILFF